MCSLSRSRLYRELCMPCRLIASCAPRPCAYRAWPIESPSPPPRPIHVYTPRGLRPSSQSGNRLNDGRPRNKLYTHGAILSPLYKSCRDAPPPLVHLNCKVAHARPAHHRNGKRNGRASQATRDRIVRSGCGTQCEGPERLGGNAGHRCRLRPLRLLTLHWPRRRRRWSCNPGLQAQACPPALAC